MAITQGKRSVFDRRFTLRHPASHRTHAHTTTGHHT
jgi:hypothetical protein